MNFCHIYDVMRYAEDFSWTWLQCRIVSREFLGVVKRAMLDRIVEVGCGGEGHITSFMLVCMINMPWCLPALKQVCSEDVWKIVQTCQKLSRPTSYVGVRQKFARDCPDLVAYQIVLQTELNISIVMPSVLKRTQKWPLLSMARFETGSGGNFHAHGFSCGKAKQVVDGDEADFFCLGNRRGGVWGGVVRDTSVLWGLYASNSGKAVALKLASWFPMRLF